MSERVDLSVVLVNIKAGRQAEDDPAKNPQEHVSGLFSAISRYN